MPASSFCTLRAAFVLPAAYTLRAFMMLANPVPTVSPDMPMLISMA